MDIGEMAILVGFERTATDVVRGGQTRLSLDRPYNDLRLGLAQEFRAVGVSAAVAAVAPDQPVERVDVADLLLEQPSLLEEGDHALAVGAAQGGSPALVLLEQTREALPP